MTGPSRREVLAGLAAVAGVGAYEATLGGRGRASARPDGEWAPDTAEVAGLAAVLRVVGPPGFDPDERFFERVVRRLSPERRVATARTLRELDRHSRTHYGRPFVGLSRTEGDALLRRLGVGRVASRPEGTLAERTRYHLVNTLLYATLTRPAGTAVYGVSNPTGYAGGFASNEVQP